MTEPAIVADGLVKRFGDVVALDGVDLTVPAGTVFGLLGPNGAGKTTAVRIMTTVIEPDGGFASVLGHDVVRDAAVVRGLIGLAGQYAAVDENLTARENLRLVGRLTHLPGRVIRERTDSLLERFDLVAAADRPARTYSGGMRRRLDLAAALVHRPPVLFLDEPTTGLDPRSRLDLWAVIGDLVRDGATVLLTTQYLEEADRLAERVAVVDGGHIIAEGTPTELKAGMGATVLELGLADDAEARRAAAIVARIGRTAPRVEGASVEVTVDGPRLVADALRALDDAGIELHTLQLREPSLDDVFLALTGHRATAAGEPNDAEPPVSPPILAQDDGDQPDELVGGYR